MVKGYHGRNEVRSPLGEDQRQVPSIRVSNQGQVVEIKILMLSREETADKENVVSAPRPDRHAQCVQIPVPCKWRISRKIVLDAHHGVVELTEGVRYERVSGVRDAVSAADHRHRTSVLGSALLRALAQGDLDRNLSPSVGVPKDHGRWGYRLRVRCRAGDPKCPSEHQRLSRGQQFLLPSAQRVVSQQQGGSGDEDLPPESRPIPAWNAADYRSV